MPSAYSPNDAVESPYYKELKAAMRSRLPEDVAAMKAANDGFYRLRAVAPGSVHVDRALANLSIQYSNGAYIGDRLMPVVTGVDRSGIYFEHDRRSQLAYPDDELGARGSPNELNQARSTKNYSTKGYGYKEYVDGETIANQDAPLDELADATNNLNEGVAFRRELRIAAIATTPANYGGNTLTLALGDRWDSAGGGDPIGVITRARAALWSGRGASKIVAFASLDVFNILARHAAILGLFRTNGSGLATAPQIAQFFGIDEFLVSEARKDTANEAQAASYARIWPNVFGVVRVATSPSIRNASFGYTFRWKDIQTSQWFDPSLGTMGGYYTKVTTNEDHKIVAADTGYLVTGVLA